MIVNNIKIKVTIFKGKIKKLTTIRSLTMYVLNKLIIRRDEMRRIIIVKKNPMKKMTIYLTKTVKKTAIIMVKMSLLN